jgi:DNA-binding Lrp family transcriptional regulator
MPEMKLDAIDKKILDILQENGRLSNNELARRIGLTATPTLERVRRLERDGIIKGYRTIVDEEKIGKGLTVFVSISLAMHKLQAVEEFCDEVDKMPEVLACYHTTGEADFLLKVVVSDTADYEHVMWQKLTRLPGVQRIHSMVVLSTRKDETKIPIDLGEES